MKRTNYGDTVDLKVDNIIRYSDRMTSKNGVYVAFIDVLGRLIVYNANTIETISVHG